MKSIFDFFPLNSEPRKSQVTALEWLAERKEKYLLLEIPVGGGKSPIGICYANYLQHLQDTKNASFILTPQRILQEQYTSSFSKGDLASLYGKSNYKCIRKKMTCDMGSIFKTSSCTLSCPHKAALSLAVSSPNTVMNYKLALLSFRYTRNFIHKRPLMILDECHNVEEFLTEFDSINVTHTRAKKYNIKQWPDPTKTDIIEAFKWVKNIYLPGARKYLLELGDDVEPIIQSSDPTEEEVKKVDEYMQLSDYIDEISTFCKQNEKELIEEYVLIFSKTSFKFKRITGRYSFYNILYPKADQFLFMSSTILNKTEFCIDLGLPLDDTAFLSLDSEFPIEQRQTIYIPKMKMNYTWKDENREKERKEMIQGVKKILELHSEESGIIHTGNFKISEWLTEALLTWPEAPHEFFHHNPDAKEDRSDVIRNFTNSKNPSILISPSITEGLDLYNELSRFAIFVKIGFPNLGDQWVKRRKELSEKWYQRQALINIIQGGGRIVRSKEDWGVVYILDKSWDYLFFSSRNMVPKWWKDAYTKI